MLDASILIGLLSGTPAGLGERVTQCEERELAVPAIAFEVAVGSWRGKRPFLIALDQLPGRVAVMPFDELAAKHYARLPFDRGRYDRLIAAHALALNLTLVTDNECDFADIPGLVVEKWTQ